MDPGIALGPGRDLGQNLGLDLDLDLAFGPSQDMSPDLDLGLDLSGLDPDLDLGLDLSLGLDLDHLEVAYELQRIRRTAMFKWSPETLWLV